jgi:hypothetical protein
VSTAAGGIASEDGTDRVAVTGDGFDDRSHGRPSCQPLADRTRREPAGIGMT